MRSRRPGPISGTFIDTRDLMPVTYINSTAELKAFCGRHGGVVCTSSNARAVLEWSFSRRRRALFFPDQHLGRNTARTMNIPLDEMVVWDPRMSLGGNTAERIGHSRVVLWKGHCSVHQMFKPAHVSQFREKFPEIKILVHPECMMEVVDSADMVGSTEYIIQTIERAPRVQAGQSAPSFTLSIGCKLKILTKRFNFFHPWSACARPCTALTCLISPGVWTTWLGERPRTRSKWMPRQRTGRELPWNECLPYIEPASKCFWPSLTPRFTMKSNTHGTCGPSAMP